MGNAALHLPRALLQTICPVCATGQMTKRTNGTKYFATLIPHHQLSKAL